MLSQLAWPPKKWRQSKNSVTQKMASLKKWQGRQESNSQPLVLETSALPIELHPCFCPVTLGVNENYKKRRRPPQPLALYVMSSALFGFHQPGPLQNYSTILVTTPEPTVRPPSRIANRTPSSIAIGLCNSTVTRTLSPGIHISAPIKLAVPVTSVVRK